MGTTNLRYEGRGDLSFRDGSNAKRKVGAGESFAVDPDTAAILLQDPNVVPDDLPRGNSGDAPQGSSDVVVAPTKKELRAHADALGLELRSKATNDELTA